MSWLTENLHRPSLEAQEGDRLIGQSVSLGSLALDLAPSDPLHLRLNKSASKQTVSSRSNAA